MHSGPNARRDRCGRREHPSAVSGEPDFPVRFANDDGGQWIGLMGELFVTDRLVPEGGIALWWVVPLARLLLSWALRPDEGDARALCRGCVLVGGPFLRSVPILTADERAELWHLVETHLPERCGDEVRKTTARCEVPHRAARANPAPRTQTATLLRPLRSVRGRRSGTRR